MKYDIPETDRLSSSERKVLKDNIEKLTDPSETEDARRSCIDSINAIRNDLRAGRRDRRRKGEYNEHI